MPDMDIPIIVQARMNSKRLPGKSLAMIEDKPSLGWLCERLAKSEQCGEVIVATSAEKSDDPIARYCEQEDINLYRGDLHNVALRFLDLVKEQKAKAFVRICGDSPLFDWRLLDEGVKIFKSGGYDLVTNVFDRKFPKGQSFEIVAGKAFEECYNNIDKPDEYEHVTLHFYRHKEKYTIYDFRAEADYSDVNLCIDTAEDYERITHLAKKIGSERMNDIGWKNIVAAYMDIFKIEA